MNPINANEVQLLFLVKSEKGEEYITATVKSIYCKIYYSNRIIV